MKKVCSLLLLVLLLLSCSDSKDEELVNTDFKNVKVVVTRESKDLSQFFLNTILTIANDSKNYQINHSDFDMVAENDETSLLLIKRHKPVTSRYEVEIKLREVQIQWHEHPMLEVEVDDEAIVDLTTKLEIFVDGKLKSTQNFVFDAETANVNIVQYSEK